MSLTVWLMAVPPEEANVNEDVLFSANITHNLNHMAGNAGIYKHLWRPSEIGIARAIELIAPLREGLALLESDPRRFELFNSPNGWGVYDNLVTFVRAYLAACEANPGAYVDTYG